MNIWQSFSGTVTVEITSAEPSKLFDAIAQSEIPVSCMQKITELIYQFRISRRDFDRLSRIIRKRADKLTVIGRQGIYWNIRELWNRPVLIMFFCLLTALTLYLPTRILLIEVSGNQTVPARQILDTAENCGICFGSERSHVRSEKVKNELLSALPQLQWAGINTSGCRAVVSVRERTEPEAAQEDNIVTNLIADQDAYILSATVTGGTAMVQPGDTIMKGQILISGYTDCGLYIQAARASGEILAQTNRSVTAIMPDNHLRTGNIKDVNYKISLLIGKKRINLWKDSRISDAGCGRMYEEYFVSLPGGFQLPIAICIDRYMPYELQDIAIVETEASQALQQFSDAYLLQQMTAGQIIQKQQNLTWSDGAYMLKSDYVCTEIIGKERREQIGDLNGKRN